ncbi:ig-like domain-containing protein [Trichonephila clavipes]|nr:ig-like domain-containing protein [Trichonephila clavipes]
MLYKLLSNSNFCNYPSQIDDNDTIDHGVTVIGSNLEVTSKTLQLPVTESLLSKGKVAIKCEASFYGRVAMISRDITIIEIDAASSCGLCSTLLLIIILITLWPGFSTKTEQLYAPEGLQILYARSHSTLQVRKEEHCVIVSNRDDSCHTPGIALHATVTGKCPSSPEDEQQKQGESRDR